MGIKTRGYTDEDRNKGRSDQSGGGGAFPKEGTYPCVVEDARYDYLNNGSEKLTIEAALELPGGNPNGEPVIRRYGGFTDNEAAMANVMEAFAQPNDPEEVEPDQLIRRNARAVIKHSKPDKNGKIWANIAYFLPPERAPQQRGQRPAQGYGQQRGQASQQQRAQQGRPQSNRAPDGARTYGGNAPAPDEDLPF